MSRTKWILTLIGVVIVAVILWRIFAGGGGNAHGPGEGGANEAVPVTVVPAKATNVPIYLTGSGTVTPINTFNVLTQVGGQLMKLDFVVGKPVEKGEVLA
jgi:multidrug efflux system membrane fusion protein